MPFVVFFLGGGCVVEVVSCSGLHVRCVLACCWFFLFGAPLPSPRQVTGKVGIPSTAPTLADGEKRVFPYSQGPSFWG